MEKRLIQLLQDEMVPAVGCTEPASVALAAALTRREAPGQVEAITLRVSPSIYKNAKSVGIPRVEKTGVEMAALLGLSMERPSYDLEILSQSSERDVENALSMLEDVPLQLHVDYQSPNIFIEIEIRTDQHRARAQIIGKHNHLAFLERDDSILLDRIVEERQEESTGSLLNYPLKELIELLLSIPSDKLAFLRRGEELNMEMARAGLNLEEGLRIGPNWSRLMERGLLGQDIASKIACYTSAACNARMAGLSQPVMSVAGSGNHGLVAIIPIALAAGELRATDAQIIQALGLSYLLTIYIKEYTGRLSSTCGCGIAAGVGASVGLAHLLGSKKLEEAGMMVISSLAGMVCDGGKVSCSLKLSASATMAWQGALLAMEGTRILAGEGIVGDTLEQTIFNLGVVSNQGMKDMDKAIISVLTG